MNQVFFIIMGCALSAFLAFIVWYLREIKVGFLAGQIRQDSKIEKIEEKLDTMPEKYVFRDDFVRWSISIDKKIDDLKADMKYLINREEKK